MIGWIGLGLLIIAYTLLINNKTKHWFIPVDTVASGVLTLHAAIIWDIPFLIVNGWITLILAYKWIKRDMEI